MSAFTHLHVHSDFSLLDGLGRIEGLLKRAHELEMGALALTDHGVLYGAIDFYLAAKEMGIKPLVGLEAYVAPGSRFDRKGRSEDRPGHLGLIARDRSGYHNLIRLVSKAHLEGFYYKPRIDRELLSQHTEGLICLTGCASGEAPRLLFDGDRDGARNVIRSYQEILGAENVYVELQRHDWPELEAVNRQLVEIAREIGAPIVATNDVHYIYPQDTDPQDLLLCIQTNATVDDAKRLRMRGNSYYLKSQEEMASLFADLPEAIENTQGIVDRCDLSLEFDRVQLPEFPIPDGYTPDTYLEKICWEGLRRRYRQITPEIDSRLRYELSVYKQTGFAQYMLIAWDIVSYARKRGIPFGPRGSAAGSLVCYCLGISDVEPLANRLVFERFLNIERREMPDVDMDFADDRRDEMIEYVTDKYGRDHVAQIITFGTLGAKAAIRDVGRALGMSYGDVDRVAKLVPSLPLHITIDQAMADRPELQQLYADDPAVARLIDMAKRLAGVSRHASTHAAGVVISHKPLAEVVPLQPTVRGEGALMTQYHMGALAKIGLLKMDFLGLANLTIMRRALEIIQQSRGLSLELHNLPQDDERTFEMLGNGETVGLFQLEGRGMTQYIAELKPNTVGDLAAMIALYRPGPMANIPQYIARKHGAEPIEYPHPLLEEPLKDTYGILTYQDQVLQVLQKVAGYSLGEADLVRRAMSKKIRALMEEERPRFVEGCLRNGLTELEAKRLWDLLEPFAGYGFNRAHAACYAQIAYQTAYLKANYPVEYMTAVLDSAMGNTEKVANASAECRRLRIPVLRPDVNHSAIGFATETDRRQSCIRFGLAGIKNVGASAVEPIIAARQNGGPFHSADDFCERVDTRGLNRRTLESLIKAGALDSLGRRSQLLAVLDRILGIAQQNQKAQEMGQTSLFDLLPDDSYSVAILLPDLPDTANSQKLAWEKELLGVYVSEHPLQRIPPHLSSGLTACGEIDETAIGEKISVIGMVRGLRLLMTRKQDQMAMATLEDLQGTVDIVVFPRVYERTRDLWQEDAILVVQGKVETREDQLQIVVADASSYQASELGDSDSEVSAVVLPATEAKMDNGYPAAEVRGDRISEPLAHQVYAGSQVSGTSGPGRRNGPGRVADRGPRRVLILVNRSDDPTDDIARFRSVQDVLAQHTGGGDCVALRIVLGERGTVELEMPDLRVRCDGRLQKQLVDLVGAECLLLEEG